MTEYVVDLANASVKTVRELSSSEAIECLWGLPVRERIVRCKDCKSTAPYGDGIDCLGPLVQTWDFYNDQPLHNPVRPEGFCAWGVPKEES